MKRRSHFLIRSILLAATFTLLSSAPVAAQTAQCGDVNDSGGVTSTDALLVLKGAVGQPVDLICDQCGSTCPGDPRYLLGQWFFQSEIGEELYEDNYDLFAVDEVNCEMVGQDLDDLGIVFAYAGAEYDYVLLDPSETYCDLFLLDYVGPDEVEGFDVLLDLDEDLNCDFDSSFDEGTMIGDRITTLTSAGSARASTSTIVGPQRPRADRLKEGVPSMAASDRKLAAASNPRIAAAIQSVRERYEKRHRR